MKVWISKWSFYKQEVIDHSEMRRDHEEKIQIPYNVKCLWWNACLNGEAQAWSALKAHNRLSAP